MELNPFFTDQKLFIGYCKRLTMEYINKNLSIESTPSAYEICVVDSSSALNNYKALIKTSLNDDVFEFIYNDAGHYIQANIYKKSDCFEKKLKLRKGFI